MNDAGWCLLQQGKEAAAYNMALDEALLESAPELGRPVLRFYGWLEAAASFGYAQKYAEIERWTLLRPLLRRPTGGGLVPHDADWTYSVALPPDTAWASGASDQRIFILRRHRLTVAVSNETDHPMDLAALNRVIATALVTRWR